jgi:ABC-type lipoprotein export system ATPase subunit
MHYLKQFIVEPENESLLIAEAFGIQEGWVNKIVDIELPDILPTITLITGDSGCGKSTLLKMIGQPPSIIIPATPLHTWGSTEEESLKLLNIVGLNDASLFVLKYNQLSDSQQARARMYYCLCKHLQFLGIDEFLSTLDRTTAQALAFSFQKAIRKNKLKLVVATAHTDLVKYLQPDLIIAGKAFPSRWTLSTRKDEIYNPFFVNIFQQTKLEYRLSSLGELHYKGKYTGGRQEYFCAKINDEIVGWLVGKLLPGTTQYRIARLVVHPTYRGCGIGQQLIKYYLNIHPDCDVVSAMATFNPVFEHAGMQRVADVVIKPPSMLKEIPLSPLQWASKKECFKLMQDKKYRNLISSFASSQFVNPGGRFNGCSNRKQELITFVKNNSQAASAVLWGMRPHKMAKYVGPTNKNFKKLE